MHKNQECPTNETGVTGVRIAIAGASGVGKTTLVELLAPSFRLPSIPELGRELCTNLGYERIGDIPDQEDFKRRVLAAQIAEEERWGSFISDRSTIDCWVLWQRWNICQAMTYDTEAYYNEARLQARKYTHIVYVPPMFAPPEDGFRWTNTDYQQQIDRLVRMTLYEWNLLDKTFTVSASTPEERARETAAWLENRGARVGARE